MKIKKILISIISLAIIIAMMMQGIAIAVDGTEFGITEYGESGYTYALGGNPNDGGAQIWKIKEYKNGRIVNHNVYCARAGRGFGAPESGRIGDITQNKESYPNVYDMIKDKTQAKASLSDISSLNVNGTEVSVYDCILRLADLFYLSESDDTKVNSKEQDKWDLLKEAFKEDTLHNLSDLLDGWDENHTTYVKLTDDDIVAVQQAAMWYFTNYDETKSDGKKYDYTGKQSILNAKTSSTEWKSLTDIDNDKGQQADALYNYLVKKAIENAKNNYYVQANKLTLYTDETNKSSRQPLIVIEKGEVKFDLSLRKNIVSVNGETTKTSGRTPEVNTNQLNTDDTHTTATYNHKKDPVEVKTGDTVKYRLTIYNEGDKAGKATEVTDRLPTGLEYVENQAVGGTGNYKFKSYDKGTNTVIFQSQDSTKILNPFKQGNSSLDSVTIEFDCKVKATNESTEKDKILTNIAWISEEYNAADNLTIKEQKGADRDSEPSTKPTESQLVTEGDNMGYTGKNSGLTKEQLSQNNYFEGQQDDDDFEKVVIPKREEKKGKYNIDLIKEDSEGEQLSSTAKFEVTEGSGSPVEKQVTGQLQIVTDKKITEQNVGTQDTYTIKELEPPDEYCKFDGTIHITVTKGLNEQQDGYKATKVDYTVTDKDGEDITEETGDTVNVYVNDEGNIFVKVKNYQFDLKLLKRITAVNEKEVNNRITNVDISKLADGTETTADYKMEKDPVRVKKGDIVTYTFRVYNEGEIDGYASEITEDIPEGLEFVWSEKMGEQLNSDTTLTEAEKKAIEFNQTNLWTMSKMDANNKVTEIKTEYLSKQTSEDNLIKAFNKEQEYSDTDPKNPDYKEVSVMLKVVTDDIGKVIRNEAAITNDTDKDGNDVDDRDSTPEDWNKENDNKYYDEDEDWPKYKEDDEDYDNIVIDVFDVALRKFIVAVSRDETISNEEYMKNENGTYTRAPKVDTSKLNTLGEDGKMITTATYNHTKQPVEVRKGDYVVYMLRAYNEGNVAGYAAEIKDHLPEYLEFVDGDFNKKYGWEVSKDGRTVTTKYLAAEQYMLDAATTNSEGKVTSLDYEDVPILCKVKDTAIANQNITNIADITEYKDENKESIEDRDSTEDNVKLPEDKDLPSYKDDEKGEYVPGQEDDDDFEKVVVRRFDLALRKFITKVEDKNVTTRIPQVKYEDGKIKYEHPKDPVDVVNGNIVTYTLRIFNEGDLNGYASVITDDIPDGLEFLPENDLNKEMRWVMYAELPEGTEVPEGAEVVECKLQDSDTVKKYIETKDASKAVIIRTDYLSKEQGEARMKENTQLKENPNLLKAFDASKEISETNPDYKDIQVAFKVIEPNGSDRIITNYAQISDDTDENGDEIDDDDSKPDEWNDGEDDQDEEHIRVPEFDLALRKWVTQAIVIENGKQTVTNTGHKPYDDPEGVVKVELHRKKLDKVTVKFRYSIRITNQGEIEGYAKEITDYVPEGLKFVAEDNPGWTDEGNNVISTRLLENTLLKPGEYADVEVLLTWINNKDNLGLKTNTAEISEDYNEKGVRDKDSTPDNKKKGEDDIDDAPVMLSVSTGQERIYYTLGFTVLITLAGGIVLIKKFVL